MRFCGGGSRLGGYPMTDFNPSDAVPDFARWGEHGCEIDTIAHLFRHGIWGVPRFDDPPWSARDETREAIERATQ